MLPGETPITAWVPVPVRETVACVVSAPVYLIVSVSGSAPVAVGLKATVIVHLAAAPLVRERDAGAAVGQLVVRAGRAR